MPKEADAVGALGDGGELAINIFSQGFAIGVSQIVFSRGFAGAKCIWQAFANMLLQRY